MATTKLTRALIVGVLRIDELAAIVMEHLCGPGELSDTNAILLGVGEHIASMGGYTRDHMHRVCMAGYVAIAEMIIERTRPKDSKWNPAKWLAKKGMPAIPMLVDHGLFAGAFAGHHALVARMIELGADAKWYGRALMLAHCGANDLAVIHYLMAKGAQMTSIQRQLMMDHVAGVTNDEGLWAL